ncbi:MAG: biopolymer transporter ExbD, partial [Acinetobacter sp.]
RFNEAGELETKPTVQLRADKESRYDMVAQVMSRASEAGLADIAFVSDN